MADKQKIISTLCGIVAALSIAAFLALVVHASHQRQNDLLARYGGSVVEVCVAKHNLKAGQRINQDDIAYQKWPVTLLAGHPILKKNMLALRDRRVSNSVLKGEPISREHIRSKVNRFDAIAEGFTAVTLETDSVRALGGEITAGMDVTVMTTRDPSTSKVLVQKAEVLSSNKQVAQAKESSFIGGSDKSEITWVTLAIPDAKVEEVVAASVADSTYIVLPKNENALFETPVRSDESTLSLDAGGDEKGAGSSGAAR